MLPSRPTTVRASMPRLTSSNLLGIPMVLGFRQVTPALLGWSFVCCCCCFASGSRLPPCTRCFASPSHALTYGAGLSSGAHPQVASRPAVNSSLRQVSPHPLRSSRLRPVPQVASHPALHSSLRQGHASPASLVPPAARPAGRFPPCAPFFAPPRSRLTRFAGPSAAHPAGRFPPCAPFFAPPRSRLTASLVPSAAHPAARVAPDAWLSAHERGAARARSSLAPGTATVTGTSRPSVTPVRASPSGGYPNRAIALPCADGSDGNPGTGRVRRRWARRGRKQWRRSGWWWWWRHGGWWRRG